MQLKHFFYLLSAASLSTVALAKTPAQEISAKDSSASLSLPAKPEAIAKATESDKSKPSTTELAINDLVKLLFDTLPKEQISALVDELQKKLKEDKTSAVKSAPSHNLPKETASSASAPVLPEPAHK